MSTRFDAEDALQNALISIITKMNQFDDSIGSFDAWSNKIVVNECIMILRKNKKIFTTELNDQLEKQENDDCIIHDLTQKEITKLVQNLPDGYRLVFNLFAIEGYSHQEIASLLSITEGTSKSQLFKARKMLKTSLDKILMYHE